MSEEQWYAQYDVPAEDHGVLGKYQDAAEAVKSIGERERYLSQSVKLPDAKAKPEERTKQVRAILQRLGAFEGPDGYRAIMKAHLPDDLKDEVTAEEIEEMAEQAHANAVLPDVFEKAFKQSVERLAAAVQGRQKAEAEKLRQDKETEAEKLRREKADDEYLATLWGSNKTNKLKDGEAFAKHLDSVFAERNRKLFSEEDLANGGGVYFRLLTGSTNPDMKIMFAEMQRRIFGEGGPRDHSPPGGGSSAWQKHHDDFMKDCGVLGEQKAREYADQMTGGPR